MKTYTTKQGDMWDAIKGTEYDHTQKHYFRFSIKIIRPPSAIIRRTAHLHYASEVNVILLCQNSMTAEGIKPGIQDRRSKIWQKMCSLMLLLKVLRTGIAQSQPLKKHIKSSPQKCRDLPALH